METNPMCEQIIKEQIDCSRARRRNTTSAFCAREAAITARRCWRIVKMYYEPEELAARLAALGWQSDLKRSADYFLYGRGGSL